MAQNFPGLESSLLCRWSCGDTRGISTTPVLPIHLVSYRNTPHRHPAPTSLCKPARLHRGLRLQPSMPAAAANIHAYFLGCSQPCSSSSCKAFSTSQTHYFLPALALFGLNLHLTRFYSSGISKLTQAGSYLESAPVPLPSLSALPCPGMPQGLCNLAAFTPPDIRSIFTGCITAQFPRNLVFSFNSNFSKQHRIS